jgi:hypothetical protein
MPAGNEVVQFDIETAALLSQNSFISWQIEFAGNMERLAMAILK